MSLCLVVLNFKLNRVLRLYPRSYFTGAYASKRQCDICAFFVQKLNIFHYAFINYTISVNVSDQGVANYILSKIRCTHLSLEKLVYYAYADYLCEHSERLFEDHIYAFRHGPVINSVYETFKRSGSQYVKPFEFGDDSDIRTGVKELPARSRILFAKEGTEKLSSIDRTIAKYGKYSAGALVDLTHRAGTPWSYVDSSVAYQEISDNLIMAYHHVESV